MRAFRPGAMMVFMNVWPVLKSLPQMGTCVSRASSRNAGTSVVRFGAPLACGTPDLQRRVRVDLAGGDPRVVLARARARSSSASGAPRPACGKPRSSRTRS